MRMGSLGKDVCMSHISSRAGIVDHEDDYFADQET